MPRIRKRHKQMSSSGVEVAAPRMMMAAQMHQRASTYCLDHPDAKPPSINGLLFPAVSFELLLLSIEQSLRLMLLLRCRIWRDIHNVHQLYRTVVEKSGSDRGMRSSIVKKMQHHSASIAMDVVTEDNIRTCLRKHDSSYSSFRYFGLDRRGNTTLHWEVKGYEVQLMHCLALSLIEINAQEMRTQGIPMYGAMTSVPPSEMTDDLRDLVDRMKEPSSR